MPSYEYRDGGMVGDALVETVLRGLADHLEPGGTAQLLGNWEYRWGVDGLDRVRSWFADAEDLDLWVVEREREDPPAYAETWIRDGGTKPGTEAFDRLVDAWLDDFATRRVTGVGFGYLVVRRASATDAVGREARLASAAPSGSPRRSVPTPWGSARRSRGGARRCRVARGARRRGPRRPHTCGSPVTSPRNGTTGPGTTTRR